MRNFKKKIILTAFLLVGILLSVVYKPAFAQSAATVSVSPASNTVAPGGTKTINITVSNAQDIVGFDGTLKFNPAVVKVNAATDVTLGSFLGSGGSLLPVTIDNTAGTVIFGGYTLATTGNSGSGTLVSIKLTAVGSGSSSLTLQNVNLGKAGIPITSQPNTVANGTITVSGTASPNPSPSNQPSPSLQPSPSILPSVSPSTPPGTANVTISPANNSTSVGGSKTINIQISGAQNIAGFGGTLKYNPAVVKVNAASNVTLGSFLGSGGSLLPVTIDNTAGTVIFGGYILSTTGASGNGTLISIKLSGVGSGTSTLTLQDVSLGTADVPPQQQPSVTTGGSITVGANPSPTPPSEGVLVIMSLQGMTKNVDDNFADIEFANSQGGSPIQFPNERITFNANGKYITLNTLTDPVLTDGTYTISINGPVHLTKKYFNVPVTNGTIIDISTPTMLTADMIDDNIINALDFNSMINNFGCKPGITPTGKSCSPLSADLDFDDEVDIYDYSFLVANYNEVGD